MRKYAKARAILSAMEAMAGVSIGKMLDVELMSVEEKKSRLVELQVSLIRCQRTGAEIRKGEEMEAMMLFNSILGLDASCDEMFFLVGEIRKRAEEVIANEEKETKKP